MRYGVGTAGVGSAAAFRRIMRATALDLESSAPLLRVLRGICSQHDTQGMDVQQTREECTQPVNGLPPRDAVVAQGKRGKRGGLPLSQHLPGVREGAAVQPPLQ